MHGVPNPLSFFYHVFFASLLPLQLQLEPELSMKLGSRKKRDWMACLSVTKTIPPFLGVFLSSNACSDISRDRSRV